MIPDPPLYTRFELEPSENLIFTRDFAQTRGRTEEGGSDKVKVVFQIKP